MVQARKIFRFKSNFRNHRCTIRPSKNARESAEGIVVSGKHVEFNEHFYETDDPWVADRLMYRVKYPASIGRIEFLGSVYECPEPDCGIEVEDEESLAEHLQQAHNREVEPAEIEILGMRDDTPQYAEDDGKPYECPVDGCKATFETKKQLSGHMIHHRVEDKTGSVREPEAVAGGDPEF